MTLKPSGRKPAFDDVTDEELDSLPDFDVTSEAHLPVQSEPQVVQPPVSFTPEQVAAMLRQTLLGDNDGIRVSYEMKQAAKGQRYYDIKVSNIRPDQVDEAMELFDKIDDELSERTGENLGQ